MSLFKKIKRAAMYTNPLNIGSTIAALDPDSREHISNTYNDVTGQTQADAERRSARQSLADQAASEAEATAQAYAELEADRKRRAKIKGLSSTILTSPLGVIGGDIQKKMLLGG